MRNYIKLLVPVVGALCISVSTVFAFSSGPPDERTGSPADNFKTCNDVGCHDSHNVDSGSAGFTISAPATYTQGEVVNVNISFNDSGTAKHGFELSALDADNNHVGAFSSIDDTTQTTNGNYIKHTFTGSNQPGNASWSVQWTAPDSEVQGPVTFYAAGNEANGDNTPQNDYIYTATAQVDSAAVTPTVTATPVVTPTTTTVCEPDFIAIKKRLKLKTGESKTIIATVTGLNDCKSEGVTVNAVVETGKKRITIDRDSATTDENGQVAFTITGGQKKGNAKISFTVEDSEGKTYNSFIIVKVRKAQKK